MPAAPAGQKIDFGAINVQPQGLPLNTAPTNQFPSPAAPQQTPNLLSGPTSTGAAGLLTSDQRNHLDQVIIKARQLGYSIDKQKLIVEDFKQKYAGQSVPETPQMTSAGTNIAPLNVEKAKLGVKNSLYSIIQQAAQGGGEFLQGIKDTAQNPIEGPIRAASGLATTALSPLAPILNPVGNVINDKVVQPIANAYGDLPQVQKFAQSPAAAGVEHAAEQVSRLTNIAGTVAGLENPAKLKTEVGAVKTSVTDTVKSAATTMHDAVTPSLEHDVGKALGFTGKMTGTTALQKTTQSTRALQTIVDNAPNLKVTDANGAEVPFNPSKATFVETLDAFNQTKNAVYKQYTDLAEKAHNESARFTASDFTGLEETLTNTAKNSTGAFKTKANTLLQDLRENYGSIDSKGNFKYETVPLPAIQDFLEKVNVDVNPLSDKAGAQVSMALSQKMRQIMDGKIENATGEGYQALRNKYADLKSIESDLVNQFKKAARGQGGTLAKVIEGFGGLDILVSVLKGDLAGGVYGAGAIGVGELLKYLKDPTKALQRAFQKLQSKPSALPNPQNPNVSSAAVKSVSIPTSIPQVPEKASLLDKAHQAVSFVKNNIGDQRGFIKVGKSPLKDFNSAQQAFLARSGQTLRNGKFLTVKDWEMLKNLLTSKGYQVPNTQVKTGQMLYDMFKTNKQRADILNEQKFNKELDQSRDSIGRFN